MEEKPEIDRPTLEDCDKAGWADVYYGMLRFYYWEPQRIGRKKPDTQSRVQNSGIAKLNDLISRLRQIEVPLNHLLGFFFSLCPAALIARFLDEPGESMCLTNTWTFPDLKIGLLTQPDLVFDGPRLRACVEIKIKSPTSIEQVLKYAFLMGYVQPHRSDEVKKKLLFLAPDDFQSLWPKKQFKSAQELKSALCDARDARLDREFKKFGSSLDLVRKSALTMDIEFKRFADLASLIEKTISENVHELPACQAYLKLLRGMHAELERRGFCGEASTAT